MLTELVGSLEASSSGLNVKSVCAFVEHATSCRRDEARIKQMTNEEGAMKTYLTLCNSILDLIDLDFTEALDLEQIATSRSVNRRDGIISTVLQLCNINSADTVSLDGIDVDNESFLAGLVGSD